MRTHVSVFLILTLATSACGLHQADPVNRPALPADKEACKDEAWKRANAAADRHRSPLDNFGLAGGLVRAATEDPIPVEEDPDAHMTLPQLYEDCMMKRGYEFK